MILAVIGAAVGLWASLEYMPYALDYLYQNVEIQSYGSSEMAGDETVGTSPYPFTDRPAAQIGLGLLGLLIGGACGAALADAATFVGVWWRRMAIGNKVSIFVGLILGIIGSLPFLSAIEGLEGALRAQATVGVVLLFSAAAILALHAMRDVLPWQKESVRRRNSGIKILDTNVIIDGRIHDVVNAGFLEGEIYVPKFVLDELQHIADSADSLRRQRGRRGLEILLLMQESHKLEIGTHDARVSADGDVDSRLVRMAKYLGGDLVSNDFNLNKVASLQDVRVLNINDLALALRPNVLPGEYLAVMITREGSQSGQGVGYLDDGTMVVVEDAEGRTGETLNICITQVIQTERGKMIFGAFDEQPEDQGQHDHRSTEDHPAKKQPTVE
ncbi:MAG: TRAM domain-containing protein [Armatimonadetes bacterium]|nr:TRAM domain-containing protein [Armatimonadota bacterium]